MFADLSFCRLCGEQHTLEWDRYLQCGEIMGWSYHYKATCKKCNRFYYVEHHPYPEKITDGKNWKLAKNTRKHILEMIANNNLPEFNLPFDVDLENLLKNPIKNNVNLIGLF